MPGMATSDAPFPPEALAIIKEMAAKKKPAAAQTGSVLQMARAGVLAGKKICGSTGGATYEGRNL